MSPTTATAPRHPAPYPRYVLDRLELWLGAERRELGRPLRILDPFAGVGRIHDLPRRLGETVGVEIEPEWANLRKRTIVGDATQLPEAWTATFDAVATSCCYGSRMADHHEAKDSCYVCKGAGVAWTPTGCADVPFVCPECHDIACKCGGHAKALRAHVLACPTCRRAVCKACGGNGLSRRYTYRHALGRPLHDRNAGQMQWGCLAPGARVLRGDWRWVPVETLRAGDALIGFDEEIPDGSRAMRMRGRRWRPSEVEAIDFGERRCVDVEFEDGGRVRCTEDHPWLADRATSKQRRGWRPALDLRPGDQIPVFFNDWSDDDSYEAGWLAGILDGEGSVGASKGRISIAQKDGIVFNRVLDVLERRGLAHTVRYEDHANTITITGDLPTRAELLGQVRPVRLLPKLRHEGIYMRAIGARRVASVRRCGTQTVVLMGTTTQTYVAEGMGSHNTAYRCLHADAWREAHRVLRPGALMLLNVKNHYRGDVEQLVAEWHVTELKRQGFEIQAVQVLLAMGLRQAGANAERRVDHERVIVARAR